MAITATLLPVELPLSDGYYEIFYANHGDRFALAYYHPDGKGRLMVGQIDGTAVVVGPWAVMPEFPQGLQFLDHDHLVSESGYMPTSGTAYPEDYGSFNGYKTFVRSWTVGPSLTVTLTDVILATNTLFQPIFVNANGDISVWQGNADHLDTEHVTNGMFSHADSSSGGEKMISGELVDVLPIAWVFAKVGENDWVVENDDIQGFGDLTAGAASWTRERYPAVYPTPSSGFNGGGIAMTNTSNFLPGRLLWAEYYGADEAVPGRIDVTDLDIATGERRATWSTPPGGDFIQNTEITANGQVVVAYFGPTDYVVAVDVFGTEEHWSTPAGLYPVVFGFGASNALVWAASNHYGDGTPSALYLISWAAVPTAITGEYVASGRTFWRH